MGLVIELDLGHLLNFFTTHNLCLSFTRKADALLTGVSVIHRSPQADSSLEKSRPLDW